MDSEIILTQGLSYNIHKSWHYAFHENPKDRKIKILEIGTYQGGSVITLSQEGWFDNGSTMTCVDNFDAMPSVKLDWLHNINLLPHKEQVTLIEKKSNEFFAENTETFDLIYVDGSHEFMSVIKDGRNSHRVLNPGGVLIFDDYSEKQFPEVYRAVNRVEKDWEDMEMLWTGYHRIYRKKLN